MTKVAIIQKAPVFLDKKKTIESAVSQIEEAVSKNANLIVFPETYIPGYPVWIWRMRPGSDSKLYEQIHSRLLDNSVNLESDDLKPLYDAAKKYKVTIVCGINEKDNKLSQSTIYNTVVTIGPDGTILNRHRKLMPTNPERMVWGFGDASGLKVIDTPVGRLGTLICWENFMPLARYTLYGQGVEIYIAPTYDSGDGWVGTMQHIAREARCWVVGSGTALKACDIPNDFPGKDKLYPKPDEWVNTGDSVVVAPGGEIVAGPLREAQDILYSDIDVSKVGIAKRTLDIVGHYSRPDIFELQVNTKPQSPIKFD
ncbi:carbon-nitrogen hydrolase family protein [Candidatus Neomarinimicrobiota bacterium]